MGATADPAIVPMVVAGQCFWNDGRRCGFDPDEPGQGWRDSASDEPGTQTLSSPRKPALDRSDRTAEPCRRFIGRRPLQKAQHKHLAVLGREPSDLRIQNRQNVRPFVARLLVGIRVLEWLVPVPAGADSSFARNAPRDAVEPRPHPVRVPQPPCIPRQNQERRLKGVLRVVHAAENPPAHAEDHRPVASYERLKCRLAPLHHEAGDERGISHGFDAKLEKSLQLPESHALSACVHPPLPSFLSRLSNYCRYRFIRFHFPEILSPSLIRRRLWTLSTRHVIFKG